MHSSTKHALQLNKKMLDFHIKSLKDFIRVISTFLFANNENQTILKNSTYVPMCGP
jgi:hypothetical protein